MMTNSRSDWEPHKLDELGFVGRGRSRHRPRDYAALYGGPYPFFQTGDVKSANLYLSEPSQTYSELGLAQSKLWPRGTLCITIAANIAESAILARDACFPDSVVGFIPDRSRADVRFVKYLIDTLKLRMQSISRGTTQDNLSLDKLLSFDLLVPDITIQRKIAAVLSAYDDLIENNTRRIAILEEMARSLYREWFVDFRFPGHEDVAMVESAIGMIPNGWQATPFDALLVSMTGGDWGSDAPTESESAEVAIIRGTDFGEVAYGGDLRVPVRYIKPSSLKSRGLRPGDVIVENSINAKSRCIGTPLLVDSRVLARLGREVVAASFCKTFRFLEPTLAPLAYLHLRHLREVKRMEYYQNVAANGIGNFQAQKFAREEHLTVPVDPAARAKFVGQVAVLTDAVSLLASQIRNLRETRDYLLPKLISGEVDVSDLDIAGVVAPA